VYAYRNVASTIDVRWTVDVDYYVELTNRLPYNTDSLTVPLKQTSGDYEEPVMMKKHGPVSLES
jgi:hypothetical protein